MTRLLIAGSRDFNDYPLLKEQVLQFISDYELQGVEIVSGAARGADALGEVFAREHGLVLRKFPANWDLHGRSAGYKRNSEMVEYITCGVIFWDNKSKGTKHMIDLCKSKSISPVRVVLFS